jgi:hypothetical protein
MWAKIEGSWDLSNWHGVMLRNEKLIVLKAFDPVAFDPILPADWDFS